MTLRGQLWAWEYSYNLERITITPETGERVDVFRIHPTGAPVGPPVKWRWCSIYYQVKGQLSHLPGAFRADFSIQQDTKTRSSNRWLKECSGPVLHWPGTSWSRGSTAWREEETWQQLQQHRGAESRLSHIIYQYIKYINLYVINLYNIVVPFL